MQYEEVENGELEFSFGVSSGREMARSGSRCERDELDKYQITGIRDSSVGLLRVLLILIFFVTGVVIGLTSSSHITWYFSLLTDRRYDDSYDSDNHYNSFEKLDCSNRSMLDDELFWRASMVPKREEYPFRRVPTVAFMFLTRGSLPFLSLWEMFFNGHHKFFTVYVHAPPGYELNSYVSSISPFYNSQIPSQKVQWGSVTLIDAERRLLANALLDFSNERFVLVSESCIPIYKFQTVYKYLLQSHHSFVESFDDPSRYGRGRYSRYMRPAIKLSDWRKGSQWFEIHRPLAVALISDTKYYNLFSKYCRPSCYPDEHYIQTLLNMFYGSSNANRTVTFVDWEFGGAHPTSYGKTNITEGFIQSLRNKGTRCSYNSGKTSVCYLFARKFSPDALEPLMNLATTVMKF